jgi:predicted transcriptional regulator
MKRGKLEIIRDILKIVNEKRSIKTTPLLRKSNLSSKRFYEYLQDLIKRDFLKEVELKSGKEIQLTEKGRRYLERYNSIVSFIEEFEL